MCKIEDISKLDNKYIIACSKPTEEEKDFLKSWALEIKTKTGEKYLTDEFVIKEKMPCFSEGGNPLILLNGDIPNKFIRIGNEIIFSC